MDPATLMKIGTLMSGKKKKPKDGESTEKPKVEPNIKYNAGEQGNNVISAMISKRNNSAETDPILAYLKKKKEDIGGLV